MTSSAIGPGIPSSRTCGNCIWIGYLMEGSFICMARSSVKNPAVYMVSPDQVANICEFWQSQQVLRSKKKDIRVPKLSDDELRGLGA